MACEKERVVVSHVDELLLRGDEARDGAAAIQINVRENTVEDHIAGVDDVGFGKVDGAVAVRMCTR